MWNVFFVEIGVGVCGDVDILKEDILLWIVVDVGVSGDDVCGEYFVRIVRVVFFIYIE